MTTWAIGDVHGCYRSMRELLRRPEVAAADRLWFVGDLVNRGPRSLDVMRCVTDLGARAVSVLGNHDLHFLARASGAASPRKHDALEELLGAPDLGALVEWMVARPVVVREGNRLLLHAGLVASWSDAEVERRARAVEGALRSPDPSPYLASYRPNAEPIDGVDDELVSDLRVFTLLRTVDPAGAPRFDFAGPLGQLPSGRTPWFDAPNRRTAGLEIVCGHWAALGLLIRPDLAALDTGCAWGGSLTAIRLEDGRIEQTGNLDA